MTDMRLLYKICFGLLAVSGIVATSCEEETVTRVLTNAPVLSVTSYLEAQAGGGMFSIAYSVGNPANDGVVTCTSNVSWLSNFAVSDGTITFFVAENTGESLRTGDISVDYGYTDGTTSKYVTCNVAVVQHSPVTPSISVLPNPLTVPYGGGVCSLSYSIENAVSTGYINCAADVDWISGFGYDTYGEVSFSVDANGGTELRTGVITFSYVYDSGEVTNEVIVIQDNPGVPGGGDITEVVGTYTAHGTVYGSGFSKETETDWVFKIYPFDGYGNVDYDGWIDGLVPWTSGMYNTYYAHRYSAGVYFYHDGTIHVPSQAIIGTYSSYYLGFTPCVGVSEGGYMSDSNFPDLVFTYNEATGKWESDYGVFLARCDESEISAMLGYHQVVLPTFTLTRTSDTTSLEAKESDHHATEALSAYSNFRNR